MESARPGGDANIQLLNPAEGFGSIARNDVMDISGTSGLERVLSFIRSSGPERKALIITPLGAKDFEGLRGQYKAVSVVSHSAWENKNGVSKIDLANYKEINGLANHIDANTNVIVIGALELLSDVRPLLVTLRYISSKGIPVTFIGPDNPEKVTGLWTWNGEGIAALVRSIGFKVSDAKSQDGAYVLSCTSDNSALEDLLDRHRLPSATIKHLIVTTEHSGYRVTGGIGSYVKECDELYGEDVGILILDSNKDVDIPKIKENRWAAVQSFLKRDRIDTIDAANFDTGGDVVFEALESLVCLYPNLESIEFQEMLAYRTIEAKKIGLFPAGIRIVTTCHGSSFHLAKAKRTVLDAENIHVAYREKFSIEESDNVIFPTSFLRESYRESGVMNLDGPTRIVKRLPFDYKRLPTGKPLKKYKRLMYVGKTSTIKGFDLFLSNLIKLYETAPEVSQQIEEVLIFATSTNIHEKPLQQAFSHVSKLFNVKMVSLDREELLQSLATYSEDTLSLITYKGDNHPLTVLELMGIGHDFLAAYAGGTPELLPKEFADQYLVGPSETLFVNAIKEAFKNNAKRAARIRELSSRYKQDQEKINKQYSVNYIRRMANPLTVKAGDSAKIHVEVIDIGIESQLERTLASIKSQSLAPDSIQVLKQDEVAKGRYTKNKKYYMKLYAGDALAGDALKHMAALLNADDTTEVVLAYEDAPKYLGDELEGTREFHPFAPELGSVFLQEKHSRRVLGLFRDSSRIDPLRTDWQNCIYVASTGGVVRIAPRKLLSLAELEGYAATDVLRNMNEMAHSFAALPVFDAAVLYSQLKRLDDIYWGTNMLGHLDDIYIRRDDPSVIHGASPALARAVGAYKNKTPRFIRKGVSFGANTTHRALRKAKHTIKRTPKPTGEDPSLQQP